MSTYYLEVGWAIFTVLVAVAIYLFLQRRIGIRKCSKSDSSALTNEQFWQSETIKKNLKHLQKNTNCTTTLLTELYSEKIISSDDEEELIKFRDNTSKLAASNRLYKIMQTRANSGYEVLTRALYQNNQSGAFFYLFEGLRQNGISNPLNRCSIDIEYYEILEANVQFLGQNRKLKTILSGLTVQALKEIFTDSQCDYDYIDIFITKSKKFVLLEETIPRPPFFYIPRSVSNRFKISPQVFKIDCDDVFIFKGIKQWFEVTELSHPNTTSTSGKLLNGETSSRFIILECDNDWEELLQISKVPIHLIKLEKEDDKKVYILEGTSGNSIVLQGFLEKHRPNESAFLSENDFMEKAKVVECVSGFCICDTPGMGKTWLLANLARNVQQIHPEIIAIFICISDFAKYIQKQETQNVGQLNAEHLVLKYITKSALSAAILLKAVTKKAVKMHLFCDGLDELSREEDIERVVNILKKLIENESGKIFVSSRPELRRRLETTLGVIAYDILPFTQHDQERFFVNFWKQEIKTEIPELKLKLCASKLIENLNKSFNQQERDLMGIPLQCRLLAKVHCKEARRFLNSSSQQFPTFSNISIFEMYSEFMDISAFDHVNNIQRADNKAMSESQKEKVKTFYAWKALDLLFPEIASDYAQLMAVNRKIPFKDILSFGILEHCGSFSKNAVSFVHRTFAEFLVADICVKILFHNQKFHSQQKVLVEKIVSFFATNILSSDKLNRDFQVDSYLPGYNPVLVYPFKYPVITVFLNNFFASAKSIQIEKPFHKLLTNINPPYFHEILQSCALHNLMFVLSFLLENIRGDVNVQSYAEFMIKNTEFPVYQSYTHTVLSEKPVCLLLLVIATYSNGQMMNKCFQLFLECLNLDLTPLCVEWGTEMTPLQLAVERCDYELAEVLIKKFSYQPQDLLGKCMKNSYLDNSDLLKIKLQIFQLILHQTIASARNNENKSVKEIMKNFNDYGGKINLEFFKCLIQEEVSFDENTFTINIVHTASVYMPPDDLHELFYILISNCKTSVLFQKNIKKWKSPIHAIFGRARNLRTDTVEMLLDDTGIDVNEIDDDKYGNGDNLILAAAHIQSKRVIQVLVNRGADYKFRNIRGENVLHWAVLGRNLEVVKYFLSLGVSLEERDNEGNTPLLRADIDAEMIKYLVNKGADVFAKDNHGNTIAHKAARAMDAKDFHDLVVFTPQIPNAVLLINARNNDNLTPVEGRARLKRQTSPETIKLLESLENHLSNSISF